MWAPAVNGATAFGRWDYIEIRDPWDAKALIRKHLAVVPTRKARRNEVVMPPRRRATPQVEVEATRHQDKRANIPTTELRDFVREEELSPTRLRYQRDLSLDPQLVWKGKDEQDGSDLEVAAVPIYVQEKIEPKALVEELRRRSAEDAGDSRAKALLRFRRAFVRGEDRLLPPRSELVEPNDPRRFPSGHGQPGRERRASGKGPNDLPGPSVWDPV